MLKINQIFLKINFKKGKGKGEKSKGHNNGDLTRKNSIIHFYLLIEGHYALLVSSHE